MILTSSINDAHKEDCVALLVRTVQLSFKHRILWSFDFDVNGVDDPDAVAELRITMWVRNPVILLSKSPRSDGIRWTKDREASSSLDEQQTECGDEQLDWFYLREPSLPRFSMIASTWYRMLLSTAFAAHPVLN